ncbi:uncharacterized protein LOC107765368 [Nicotiana tabacum]|uniref:Uncharacterized protein LOC107765368 n=1 Tax=Nicotiana tabacum TaxID=4097 RepID=A0A1S3XI21_TOBAC|nr:uncharacterized protein LOC104087498 [Nicotiana tomentosiformis]XP_016439494.1 PREDICTED: uncharacterized protein LOC107765368 [Nicotiana tabacum]
MKIILLRIIVVFFFVLPIYSAILSDNPLVEFSNGEELGKMAGYGEEKLSTVIIHGTLLCHHHQSCADIIDTHLPPHPVSGANVAVFCGTSEGKVRGSSWSKNITNESGKFVIDLPSHLHSIPNLENTCKIQLLHLPKDSLCRRHSFTRKQYKRSIKLTSIGDGIRIYTTHKIQLITPKASQAGCTNKFHNKKRLL